MPRSISIISFTKRFPAARPLPASERLQGSDDAAGAGSDAAPVTALEALQQRLDKYKQAADQARQAANSSKARRNDRIVKVRILSIIKSFFQVRFLFFL